MIANNLPLIKLAVQVGSGLGVSKVVNDVIRSNTNVVTTFDAVRVWTGALVIGSMVAEQASIHVNDRMEAVIAWNENRKANNS